MVDVFEQSTRTRELSRFFSARNSATVPQFALQNALFAEL